MIDLVERVPDNIGGHAQAPQLGVGGHHLDREEPCRVVVQYGVSV